MIIVQPSLTEDQVKVVIACLDQALGTTAPGQRLTAAANILPIAVLFEGAVARAKQPPAPAAPVSPLELVPPQTAE